MEETFNWADCEPDGFKRYETIVFRFSSLGHGLSKCRPQPHNQPTHCDPTTALLRPATPRQKGCPVAEANQAEGG